MPTFTRKFPTAGSTISNISLFPQHQPRASQILFPLSDQVQQERKLLQHKVISILDGCNNVNQFKEVHGQILLKGLDQCSFVITKLIRMLNKLDIPMDNYPRLIFEQVRYPNPFLWNAMIRGYSLQGSLNQSIDLYNCMRKAGIGPVSFTFSALFKACGAVLDVNLGREIHAQTIFIGGFVSDLYVGNTMIDMYVKCGSLECGRKVFDEMPTRDVITWTELIVAYAKSGDMTSARNLFDGFPQKDIVSWTAMITGYAQNAQPREALYFFEHMQNENVGIDEVTLVGVISACAQLGVSKYAEWIHNVSERCGFGPSENVFVGSSLIDMYSKCGSVDDAYKVFEGMKIRNVYSYSSLVLGLAMHGRAHAAIQLFHDMLKTEIKPNQVTFIGVLTACSHVGLVEQGRQLFAIMEKSYGVSPNADHYTCLVDLHGRAGRLEEALELIETMRVEPHAGVWGALLGACCIHRNPDIAQLAANHLFELEPNAIGNYLLLCNIYASIGRWDGVSMIRKLMREKGLKKNPAYSWVEGREGDIHEFYAGDVTHPMSSQIKHALEDLLDRLKAHGYLPNLNSVSYDINDEDKKRILMNHSEKIALGFGLLSTDASYTIKIMKNLRVCEDCHAFMCYASEITGRKIIVRDNMRFHHFQKGTCSCGNYW